MSIFDVHKGVTKSSATAGDPLRIVDLRGIIFFLRGRGEAIFFSFLTILNSNFILKQFQTSSRDFIFSRRAAFVLR